MACDEQLAELDGGKIANQPSIFIHVEEGLKQNPNGPAVIVMHQPGRHLSELIEDESTQHQDGSHTFKHLSWTYTELHTAALRVSAGFMALGVQPGSTIVTLMPNGIEFPILLWVSIVMRLKLATLDFGALKEARSMELKNFMMSLKPDVVVVPDNEGAESVDRALSSADVKQPLRIVLGGCTENGWRTIVAIGKKGINHQINEQSLLEQARNGDDPNRIYSVLFTSGTSSRKPKGCPKRVISLANSMANPVWSKMSPSSRILIQSANFRVIAHNFAIRAWKFGATIVMANATFSPETTLRAIEEEHITLLFVVPSMIHAFVENLLLESWNLDSVLTCHVGGDIITQEHLIKASVLFPKANVLNSHGMTEGGGLFVWPYFNTPLDRIPYNGSISPVGRPMSGLRLRIWNQERKRVSRRNEPGEVHYCSERIIKNYLDGVNSDSFYTDEYGQWFNPGDLGLIDSDGIFYILGRTNDIIKRAGVPITPVALESCIASFINGSQTCVIGIASEKLGQEPFAICSDFCGKTEDEIKQHVLDLFGKDYALAGAMTLKQLNLDKFPLNATGKVMKIDLVEIVATHLKQ